MRLWVLRKHFKFGVIRCVIEGVMGRKPQYGNFHQTFRGPLAQNLWVRSEEHRGLEKWDGRPLCACKVWWRSSVDARRQEIKTMVFFSWRNSSVETKNAELRINLKLQPYFYSQLLTFWQQLLPFSKWLLPTRRGVFLFVCLCICMSVTLDVH